MAYGVKVIPQIDAAQVDAEALRKTIQKALDAETKSNPIVVNGISGKIYKKNIKDFRNSIQSEVDAVVSKSPILIRNFAVKMTAGERNEILSKLKADIDGKGLVITIKSIDASKAVESLRKQLTTMLSGLSITGLKEFLGTDGVTEAYNKSANAAEKMAQAQENVRKKTEDAKAALEELKTLSSVTGSISKKLFDISDNDVRSGFQQQLKAILKDIEAAKNKTGEEQDALLVSITKAVQKLKEEAEAHLESERAARKKAEAVRAAGGEAAYQAAQEAKAAKEREAAESKAQSAASQAIALKNKLQKALLSNAQAYRDNEVKIRGWIDAIGDGSNIAKSSLASIKREFSEISAQVTAATASSISFFGQFSTLFGKIKGIFTAIHSMTWVIEGFKEMWNAVKDLDAAMTELRKVTDMTKQGYADFANEATRMAKSVGATVADTINATADFARLGFDINEAQALAEASLVYKNVGDGIQDISVATESLISTIKAFQIFGYAAEDAMFIVDKFNEVGNNFSISSSGIGEALKRSASALAAAGNDLDQSIGLITGMNTVVQDPEKVGTALKTVSMYLRAAKTDAEAAGISTDGMASSVSELRKELLALTGVDIMLDDDTFKSTYEIMEDLSKVWDKLTDVSRANVLELIGGKRNGNVITSLLTNFDEAAAAMEAAQDALGSASAENEKYLDSINGKLIQLKASFESLSSAIIDSELAKVFLDSVTAVINLATWMQKMGILIPMIVAGFAAIKAIKLADTFVTIGGAIKTMSSYGDDIGSIAKAVSSLTGTMSSSHKTLLATYLSSSGALAGMTKEASDSLQSMLGLSSAMSGAATSGATLTQKLQALKGASSTTIFSTLAGNIALVAGGISALLIVIQLAVAAYDALTVSAEEASEKIAEIESSYSSAKSTYTANISTLKSLREEYNNLSKGVDESGNNVSLTADKYDRYCDIIAQIAEISPDLVQSYDTERYHLRNYESAIEDAIEDQEEYLQNQKQIMLSEGETYMIAWEGKAKNIEKQLKEVSGELGDALHLFDHADIKAWNGVYGSVVNDVFGRLGVNSSLVGTVSAPVEDLRKIAESRDYIYTSLIQSGEYAVEELGEVDAVIRKMSSIFFGNEQELIDSVTGYFMPDLAESNTTKEIYEALDTLGALQELSDGIFSVFNPKLDFYENKSNIAEYAKSLLDLIEIASSEGLMDMADSFKSDGVLSEDEIKQFNSAISELQERFGNDQAWNSALNYFNSLINITKTGKTEVDDFSTSVIGLSDALQSVDKANSVLENARNDIAEYGGITSETIQSIAAMLGEQEKITDYLYIQNGAIKLNEEAWKKRTESMLQSDIHGLNNQNALLRDENDGHVSAINNALAYINKSEGYDKGLYESTAEAEEAVKQHTEALKTNNTVIAERNRLIEIYKALIDGDSSGEIGVTDQINKQQEASNKAIDVISLWHQAQEEVSKFGKVSANTMLDAQSIWGDDWERYFNKDKTSMIEEDIRGFVSTIMFMNGVDANIYDAIFAMFDKKDNKDPTEQLFEDLEHISKVASFIKKARAEIAESGTVSLDTYASAPEIIGEDWQSIFKSNESGDGFTLIEVAVDSLINTLKESVNASGPMAGMIMSLFADEPDTSGLETLTKSIGEIKSTTGLLSSIQDELKEDGTNSLDTLSSFISSYGDGWEEHVDFTNGIRISAQAVRDLMDEQIDAMKVSDEAKKQLRAMADEAMVVAEANKSLKDSYKGVKDVVQTIGSAERDSELSYDDYETLIAQDTRYAAAVHYQNGVMTVNRDLFDEITQKIIEENKARAQQEIALITSSDRYQELIDKQQEYGLSVEELKELNSMESEIMGWTVLAQEIENANSALNRFMNTDKNPGAGSYSKAKEAATLINDVLHNEKSEWYDRKGSEEFLLAKDAMIRPDIDMSVAEKSLKRYFTNDEAGIGNFVNDLVKFNFIDENSMIDGSMIDQIAKKLNLTTEAVRTLFAEYNTYADEAHQIKIAPEIDTGSTEEGTEKTQTLIEKAQTAETAMQKVSEAAEGAKTSVEEINNTELTIDVTKAENSLGDVLEKLQNIFERIKIISNTKMNIDADVNTNETSGGGIIGNIGSFVSGLFGRSAASGTDSSDGGETLVGELGREIVVDPNENKWYTVGDNGAEFVKLPKNAIVFNAEQTKKLLSSGSLHGHGEAMASGNAAVFGTLSNVASGLISGAKTLYNTVKNVVTGVTSKVSNTVKSDSVSGKLDTSIGKKTSSKKSGSGGGSSSSSSSAKDEMTELEKLQEKYEEINSLTEHLIEHQEHLYNQSERGMDFSGMEDSLTEQARLYRQIMEDSQKAVEEMRKAGGTDADEELQDMERAYWDAYESLYDTLDKINDLYVEGLTEKIDGIQNAFATLQDAAGELSSSGAISTDTFQKLLENGVQYMSLIEKVGDQYIINKDAVADLIEAEREQLAVETALSYLAKMQQALTDGNVDALNNLTNLNNQIGTSTWAAVYAQAEMLKNLGLSNDQYEIIVNNLRTMQDISQNVADDLSDQTSDLYKDQKNAIDYILKKTQELIKYETEERIDAIEDEIDAYKEIISLKKESLKATKEENDYQKDVAEKTQEIAKLQAKIDQLSLDDSREAAAKRAEYLEELGELQGDLNDMQNDHAIDMTETMLDKQAEDYEAVRQEEIQALENKISSTEKLYQEALVRLNTGWDTIYQEIIAWNTEAGNTLNSEITENWQIALAAAEQYGSYVRALKAYESGSGVTLPVAIDKDMLPQYHTGGEVSGGKAKEVLALLEDKELVMTESAKNGLYKMIDFVQVLGERLGTAIKSISGVPHDVRAAGMNTSVQAGMKPHLVSSGGVVSFSPSIHVEFTHNGTMSDQDAERYGKKMADSAIGRFYNAFITKGVGSTPGSRLRT